MSFRVRRLYVEGKCINQRSNALINIDFINQTFIQKKARKYRAFFIIGNE